MRPAITFVIAASGLKYIGLSTTALGWTLWLYSFIAGAVWLTYIRPRQRAAESEDPDLIPGGAADRARRHRLSGASRPPLGRLGSGAC